MSRTSAIAAIFGHPVRLVYTPRFARTKTWPEWLVAPPPPEAEALGWTPSSLLRVAFDKDGDPELLVEPDSAKPQRVKEQWVYVFLFDPSRRQTYFFLELWVDENGTVQPNPDEDREKRLEWTPKNKEGEKEEESQKQEIPHTILGRNRTIAMVGAPFRLSDDCIKKFEANNTILKLVTPIDLSKREYLEVTITEHLDITADEGVLALPVLLPFEVARQMSSDIDHARSMRMTVQGQDGEFHQASADDVRRSERYVFSRSLLALADSREIGSTIKDDFAPGKLDVLRSFVTTHERMLTRLDYRAEGIGAELVAWMRRELLRILTDGSTADDSGILLRNLDEITAGLGQTAAGLSYLGTVHERHAASFLGRMFDGKRPLDKAGMKIAKSSAASYTGTLTSVYKARIFHTEAALGELVQELEMRLGKLAPGYRSSFEVKSEIVEHFAARTDLNPGTPIHRTQVRARAVVAKTESLKALDKALGQTDIGFKIIDTLNVALALREYFATDISQGDLRAKRALAAAASGGALLASILNRGFEIAGRDKVPLIARAGVRIVGFMAAAHALYASYGSVNEALARRDTDAAVALAASTGLTVAGSIMSAVGAGSSFFGPIGAALAALGGLTYLAYLYLNDSDLETLVVFSGYGRWIEDGPSPLQPSWSPVVLGELHKSWKMQSKAIGAIQRQFAVGFGPAAKLPSIGKIPFETARIFTGYVEHGTTFFVTWKWKAPYGSGEQSFTWTLGASKTPKAAKELADIIGVTSEKEAYFDADIPSRALADSGYQRRGGGEYRFDELTVLVRKQYSLLGANESIPSSEPIELTLRKRFKNLDTTTVVRSVDG